MLKQKLYSEIPKLTSCKRYQEIILFLEIR